MDETTPNRWAGKSAEDVLAESFHEIRNPIVLLNGYLGLLKSTDLSKEDTQRFLDMALDCATKANEIVDSVYHYIGEENKDR